MSEQEAKRPKRRVRFGRILFTLVLIGVIGAGLYGASWLNARRYYLVVGLKEVKVGKGKMLPIGYQPFVPRDPALRAAYLPFAIPADLNEPRGETIFDERVQLDQALFRLLRSATEYALVSKDADARENVARYLEQLRIIPGVNAEQAGELRLLEKDARYVEAEALLTKAVGQMEAAEKLFARSAEGGGGERFSDGRQRAGVVAAALVVLKTDGKVRPTVHADVPAPPVEPTATSTTSSRSRPTATSSAAAGSRGR